MAQENERTAINYRKGVITAVLFLTVVGAAFFGSYGSFNWWEAWMMLALWAAYFLLMLTVVRRVNPGVVEERASSLDRFTQSWDRIIITAYQFISAAVYIIAGLDVGRFGWTQSLLGGVPAWLKWTAMIFVLVVYVLPFWAVLTNPFASGVVRVQEERGHHAVSTGPYRLIRHPMYLGTVIYGAAFPLFLESYFALIPGLIVTVLFILRTALEDRYLFENLPGYAEYVRHTRYRLIPGVW